MSTTTGGEGTITTDRAQNDLAWLQNQTNILFPFANDAIISLSDPQTTTQASLERIDQLWIAVLTWLIKE